MTKPRYLDRDCAAGSQAPGLASSPFAANPENNAWNVNFNNGNANWNNQNNNGFVRAVRSVVSVPGEYPGAAAEPAVTFRSLVAAWRQARKSKRPSRNQLAFDTRWLDGLLGLQHALESGTWQPSPTTCFIAKKPKAREIHAPDFSDRVVHHWLVPQLERIFDSGFIEHSYSNRAGKGTHAAVDALSRFIRQVHSGEGGGWYLQLDIRNFFNRIYRPYLYEMLKRRMVRHNIPMTTQQAVHALLRRSPLSQGVVQASTPAERRLVPPHKRLEDAPPGYGLPIGNLSSQFFANVYLDALDQFVKHTLKVKRYVRYVDDFVLVHHSREQLQLWHLQIEAFLSDRLKLELKPGSKLKPLESGVDFLGYIIHPAHATVRRRVAHHAREQLQAWASRQGWSRRDLRTTPRALAQLRCIWASYQGHFAHANTHRLQQRLHVGFPWLNAALVPRRIRWQQQDMSVAIPIPAASMPCAC